MDEDIDFFDKMAYYIGNIMEFVVTRKKSYMKYWIAGGIFTVWNLLLIYILVDVMHLKGVVFLLITAPINWILKPTVYHLVGFARKD